MRDPDACSRASRSGQQLRYECPLWSTWRMLLTHGVSQSGALAIGLDSTQLYELVVGQYWWLHLTVPW